MRSQTRVATLPRPLQICFEFGLAQLTPDTPAYAYVGIRVCDKEAASGPQTGCWTQSLLYQSKGLQPMQRCAAYAGDR